MLLRLLLLLLLSAVMLSSSAATSASSTGSAAIAATPIPPIVSAVSLSNRSACEYTSPDGVRFENLYKLKNFYSDYTCQCFDHTQSTGNALGRIGYDDDGDGTRWTITANVCRESSLNLLCRTLNGSVCITNQTSGSLLVGGRMDAAPEPRFELVDPEDAMKGVALVFENAPPAEDYTRTPPPPLPLSEVRVRSVLQLRCDQRFQTANVAGVSWSPRSGSMLMILDTMDACPTYVPPPASHMPLWSIILIAVGGAAVVYLFVGCLYMRLVRGTPLGWASCPNAGLWCGVPRSIMRATSRAFTYVLNGCKSEPEVYTEL